MDDLGALQRHRLDRTRPFAAGLAGAAGDRVEDFVTLHETPEGSVLAVEEARLAVTDEELALAYAEYAQNVPAEQEVHARHILVKDEQTAQDLIAKLNNGEDFVALAQEYSEGPTGKTGGDLGFFKKNQMVAPFAEAAFSTEAGTVMQEPVQTQFGWHVIEVLEKRDAKPATFEQAKESLVNALRQKALAEHMQGLKNQYDIIKYYEQAAEDAPAADDEQSTEGEAVAE